MSKSRMAALLVAALFILVGLVSLQLGVAIG
jgi:hypothetical protein